MPKLKIPKNGALKNTHKIIIIIAGVIQNHKIQHLNANDLQPKKISKYFKR